MSKRALVTGATGKIGRMVCLELAGAGYDIGVHYFRSEQTAWEISKGIDEGGGRAVVLQADLADADQCRDLEERVFKAMGRIDALVHCAAVFEEMPLGQVTLEEWDALMAINVRAAFCLSQSIGLKMREEEKGGNIVHFSDVSAAHSYPRYLPYCISRASVDAMVRGFAVELAPQVRVNAIAPYFVREMDEMNEHDRKLMKKIPLKRPTEPKEMASIVRLLLNERCTVTGQTIVVDGGRSLVW